MRDSPPAAEGLIKGENSYGKQKRVGPEKRKPQSGHSCGKHGIIKDFPRGAVSLCPLFQDQDNASAGKGRKTGEDMKK